MTSVPKNVYMDKLDDIVDEHNNTYHRAIKIKPVDLKGNTYIDSMELHSEKDPKFKLVIMLESLSTKIFLLRDIHQIVLKKFL